MIPLFLDFETFWAVGHSLDSMGPMEYVSHPNTELISCSFALGQDNVHVAWGEDEIRYCLSQLPWGDSLAIGHNMSGFDALILAWRLGLRPKMWGCTLAMARPIFAKTTGLRLGALVKHLGIGVKDDRVLHATKGRHLADFTPEERRLMGVYNREDTEQDRQLFHRLLPHYSAMELWHIHTKISAFVESPLVLDVPLLQSALEQEKERKRASLLSLAGVLGLTAPTEAELAEAVREELSSAPKFQALLERLGAPVPLKPSPTNPDKLIPALAKKDAGLESLCDDPDEVVAAAARARIEAKSTLVETRIEKFLHAAKHSKGKFPVTANYCGADTTGRGSGWYYNPYNLPRIPVDDGGNVIPRPSNSLRGSVRAPEGCVIVVADLSGIEMRFNHFLWNVPYSTKLWKEKPNADTYRAYAARQRGIRPEDVTKDQRMASKIENLGLGFGMGAPTYRENARIQSRGKLILTLDQSQKAVTAWRELHPEIVQGWKKCHDALSWIAAGRELAIDPRGLFVTCAEGVRLPSGRLIRYPNLRQELTLEYPRLPDGTPDRSKTPREKLEWVYGEGRHKARIYAGKVDENLVQAGARDVFYEALFDIYRETGIAHVHEVYDEGIWVVPIAEAEPFSEIVHARLRKPPAWFPELVTWSEGDIGATYADAK